MNAPVDLFWSFRSAYSYLAMPGALQLERDFKVEVRFKPVLPLAVRDASFFSPDNAALAIGQTRAGARLTMSARRASV